jgi:hypothetical protein
MDYTKLILADIKPMLKKMSIMLCFVGLRTVQFCLDNSWVHINSDKELADTTGFIYE